MALGPKLRVEELEQGVCDKEEPCHTVGKGLSGGGSSQFHVKQVLDLLIIPLC